MNPIRMEDKIQCNTAFIVSARVDIILSDQKRRTLIDTPYLLKIENRHFLVIRSSEDESGIIELLLDHTITQVIMLVVGRSLGKKGSDTWCPVKDHINWTGHNPLRGPNNNRGPRFPDMSSPYLIGHSERGIIAAGVKDLSLVSLAEKKMMSAMGAEWLTDELIHKSILLNHAGILCTAYLTETVHALNVEELTNFITQNAV